MRRIRYFFAASIAALALSLTAPASAAKIDLIENGTDNRFRYSVIHTAGGNGGMSGSVLHQLTIDPGETSSFIGTDFDLYALLDGGSGGTMHLFGTLDFSTTGNIVGTLSAVFGGGAAFADTVFTFANYDYGIGGVTVPSPNSEDGTRLSLWGANGTLGVDPQTNLTDGRFQSGTATLGLDLVVHWQPVPEPGSMGTLAVALVSLFGFSVLRSRRRAIAARVSNQSCRFPSDKLSS